MRRIGTTYEPIRSDWGATKVQLGAIEEPIRPPADDGWPASVIFHGTGKIQCNAIGRWLQGVPLASRASA